MPKRALRPWERKGIAAAKSKHSPPSSPRTNSSPYSCCAVRIDGVDYFSDRFYLHRPEGPLLDADERSTVPPPPFAGATPCTCGARGPPPLLDRARLVESLSLKAAILATYTFDPGAMASEMPSLFGHNATVPTLVLHGDRRHRVTTAGDDNQAKKETEAYAPSNQESSDEEDDDVTARGSAHLSATSAVPVMKEEEPPEEAWLHMNDTPLIDAGDMSLGACVELTEILPAWLPPSAKRRLARLSSAASAQPLDDVVVLDSDDEDKVCPTRGVAPEVANHRVTKRGVHHPKYMLLFETTGSVVVVVTTSNLTRQTAVDACWVQRFQPIATPLPKCVVSDEARSDASDFGYVLSNFLECQSNAAQMGQTLPQEFMMKHLGHESLDAFRNSYSFAEAHVHLIATVPGEYQGRHGATHLDRKGVYALYGPQRVADIVARLSQQVKPGTKGNRPWLPSPLLSSDDRLVIQPTSFGGHLTRHQLAEIGRLYFGIDKKERRCSQSTDAMVLEKMDIVWPTVDFMRRICKSTRAARIPSPNSVSEEASSERAPSGDYSPFVFLSATSFNTIDLSCISRMAMYDSSIPMQLPVTLVPHIKSCARVFEGNEYRLRQEYGTAKAEEIFPYLVLSSACLSRGAQGQPFVRHFSDSDERSYSNFELGVMFTSRLAGYPPSDRLYCWRPGKCLCGKESHRVAWKGTTMIHLPLPFCLRPQSYQLDPTEAEMSATPFFHEIAPGAGFVGQMRLTPFGAKMASVQK